VITEHGKPVAAIISVDELAELQAAADDAGSPEAAARLPAPHAAVLGLTRPDDPRS